MTTFIPSNDWPKTDLAAHFKAFGCRIRELVHPEAQDIYRVHALSTIKKLNELARCCGEVLEGQYPRKALEPIVAEVEEAVNADPIVKIILDRKNIARDQIAFGERKSTQELLSLVMLWSELIEGDYRVEIEKEIIRVALEPNEKKLLLLLAKQYVSYLIGRRFHRQHIQKSVEKVFFTKKIGKCTPQLIERFFSEFPDDVRKFVILILGDQDSVDRAAEVFNLSVCNDVSDASSYLAVDLDEYAELFENQKALIWPGGKGIDPYNAAQRLEIVFSLPKFFNVVYPSADIVEIGQKCLVADTKSKEIYSIDAASITTPVHSYTSQIRYSSDMVNNFVRFSFAALDKDDTDAYRRVENSLRAGSSALNAADPQVQLVSMWSAFEALLPQPTRDENGARIEHFVDLITPAVIRKFIKGKFRIFLDDAARHSNGNILSLFGDDVEAKDRPKRFFEMLAEDGEACDKLFSSVGDSALMLARINQLFKLAKNPNKIMQKMDSHEKRVRWQIHRIYRERNSIVHAGQTSPALPVLVENSFLYYRLVMRAIQTSWQSYGICQPHGALQLIAGRYEATKRDFKIIQKEPNGPDKNQRVCDLIFT